MSRSRNFSPRPIGPEVTHKMVPSTIALRAIATQQETSMGSEEQEEILEGNKAGQYRLTSFFRIPHVSHRR